MPEGEDHPQSYDTSEYPVSVHYHPRTSGGQLEYSHLFSVWEGQLLTVVAAFHISSKDTKDSKI